MATQLTRAQLLNFFRKQKVNFPVSTSLSTLQSEYKKINNASNTISKFIKKSTSSNKLLEFIKTPEDHKKIETSIQAFEQAIDKLFIPSDYYLTLGVTSLVNGITSTTYRVITDEEAFKNLIHKIINGFDVREIEGKGGSDQDLLYDIIEYNSRINLTWFKADGPKKHSGSYWRYYNKSKFDLTRYQIFSQENYKINSDNSCCFIYALKKSKLVAPEEINNLKYSLCMNELKASDMKNIAKFLNITIKLRIDYTHFDEYNKGCAKTLNLALIDKHYFIDEKTNISDYAIKHYDEVKDHKKFPKIRLTKSKKVITTLSSYNVIRLMMEQQEKFFEPITMTNVVNRKTVDKLNEYTELRAPAKLCKCSPELDFFSQIPKEYFKTTGCILNCKENEFRDYGGLTSPQPFKGFFNNPKTDPNQNFDLWFIDTETFIPTSNESIDFHEAYDICMIKADLKTGELKKYECRGLDCVKRFIELYLTNHAIIIAHNLAFDFRQFVDACSGKIHFGQFNTPIETGTKLKQIQCTLVRDSFEKDGKTIEIKKHVLFKDSYAFIAEKLSKFPEMFQLVCGDKEVYPYTLINEFNFDKDIRIELCMEHLDTEEKRKDFIMNAAKCGALNMKTKRVDMQKYTTFYCMQDTEILATGFLKFRQQILEVCDDDILNLVSLPQLGDRFLKKNGCYDGCYAFSGVAQDFIRRCCVGGRVMSNSGKKFHIKVFDDHTIINGKKINHWQEKYLKDDQMLITQAVNCGAISDFDAVSLYPSAMAAMKGFLKGLPKVLSKEQCVDFETHKQKFDGYFIEIKVKSHTTDLDFPLQSYVDDKGIRQFTNDIDGRHFFVDNIALEDFVEYQGVAYDVIRGYYFNEGFNTNIVKTIRFMFNKRNELKKAGNPLQQIYKLLMNASYGKLLQKPITTSKKFIKADKLRNYISRNYKFISEYSEISPELYVLKEKKSMITHFACPHIGAQILSMSKRLMNQVMCLAEQSGLTIWYQDTDSMHVAESSISILAQAYKAKYGRELIGKDMGQFHSDFEVSEKGAEDIKAVETIILGKKCYIDKLQYVVNDQIKFDYHIRVKGVPSQSIRDFDSDYMRTYERLFRGEPLEFDLKKYCTMQMDKDYRVRKNTRCPSRTLKF